MLVSLLKVILRYLIHTNIIRSLSLKNIKIYFFDYFRKAFYFFLIFDRLSGLKFNFNNFYFSNHLYISMNVYYVIAFVVFVPFALIDILAWTKTLKQLTLFSTRSFPRSLFRRQTSPRHGVVLAMRG